MRKHTRRLVAVVLVAALLYTPSSQQVAEAATEADYRAQLDKLGQQYSALEKEQKAIQNELNKASTQRSQEEAKKKAVDTQVSNTTYQISLLNEQIELLSTNIAIKEDEIAHKQAQIDDRYEELKARLRAMYVTGNESISGLVLGVENFYDFLTRAEVASRIAQRDTEMLEWLRVELIAIEDAKAEIEDNKSEVEAYNQELAVKRADLNVQSQQLDESISYIAKLEAMYKQNAAALKAEMDAVEAELQKIYAQINSTGEYTGGIMGWPVPNFYQITSEYGWRFGGTDYHTGIDISGRAVFGHNIVAAADGTVAVVQRATPNWGYGLYLIVDHGGGVTTLYAHCSDIVVSVGDKVVRGQTIAKIGSTGNSTGPHLHFEVRVGGKHTPPRPYLGI